MAANYILSTAYSLAQHDATFRKISIIARFALFFPLVLLADIVVGEPHFSPTSLSDEFSGRYVQAAVESRYGGMWISTLTGVWRASSINDESGSAATLVNKSLASGVVDMIPSSNSVRVITIDGRIWDVDENNTSEILYEPSNETIMRPVVLEGNYAYLVSKREIAVVDLKTPRFSAPQESTIPGTFSSNPIEHPIHGLCAASGSSIFCGLQSRKKQQIHQFSTSADKLAYLSYFPALKLTVALDSAGRLHGFETKKTSIFNFEIDAPIAAHEINVVVPWRQYLLVGTDFGAFAIDFESRKTLPIDLGRNVRVTNFNAGRFGVWVSFDSGIGLVTETPFTRWPDTPLSAPMEVLSVTRKNEWIYIGTYHGIYAFDPSARRTNKAWPSGSLGTDTRVTALNIHKNRLFAGTFSGAVAEFAFGESGRIELLRTHSLPSGIPSMLSVDRFLFIGTEKHGLWYFDGYNFRSVNMPNEWESEKTPVTSLITAHSEKYVLFTTEKQFSLVCFDSEIRICGTQTLPKEFRDSVLLSAANDKRQNFFLGTLNRGLLQSDLSDLIAGRDLRAASLPIVVDFPIFSMNVTSDNTLWLGTNQGIHLFSIDSNTSRKLTAINGLVATNINHNASLFSGPREIAFGGREGLTIIDTSSLDFKPVAPRIHLSNVRLAYQPSFRPPESESLRGITLPANNFGMTLFFSIDDFREKALHGFTYVLEGWDSNEKRTLGVGNAAYGRLPPGNYTFRARGANALGVWSENEIVIPITVRPPAWLSWWAILFYGLAAVLMFLLFNRLYMRHLVREARLAYGEEAARAFSRLEDDWQEQREATDRLLRSIPITVSTMIHTIRSVVKSQSEAVAARGADERALPSALATIDRRLQALQQQQNLCVLSTASQTCEAQQLINELVVLVTSKARFGSRYIVLDETAELTLDAGLGQAIAIMMMELLELMVSREPLTEHIDPIVTTCIERTSEGLRIKVADPDAVSPSETLVDETLAATFALLEDFGGSIVEKDDLGYEVEIKLPEAKDMT